MHHKEENDHDNTKTSFNWKNDYPCRVEGWLNIWGEYFFKLFCFFILFQFTHLKPSKNLT